MAGGLIGSGGGRKKYRPMAEINVTPMVDVMLVLLIIFMVTAPMITSSVKVDLPNATAKPTPATNKPITISVDKQGNVYLNSTQEALPNLVATLQAASNGDPTQVILIRGDKDVSYGDMLQVMATITQGGFTKVSLLTQPNASGP